MQTSDTDRRNASRLAGLLLRRRPGGARFTVQDETGEAADLPPALLDVLEAAAGMVAGGEDVTVMARDDELTTRAAADLLNVSRQYLVRLLDRGDIPSTRVGTHRRIRAEDLAAYRRQRDAGRDAALAAMTEQAQGTGGYDGAPAFGPKRRA